MYLIQRSQKNLKTEEFTNNDTLWKKYDDKANLQFMTSDDSTIPRNSELQEYNQ